MAKLPPPMPDRETDPAAWDAWWERVRRNAARRERRLARADRLDYPTDEWPIVAEQAASFTTSRPASLSDLTVHMTLRLTLNHPKSWSSRGGYSTDFTLIDWLPLSGKARYLLENRMSWGVTHGLQSADHPGPLAELNVDLTRMEIDPPPAATATPEEIERLRQLLYAAVKGSVTALWGSVLALWQQQRHLEPPNLGREWYVIHASATDGSVTASITGTGYPSREAAELAMTVEEHADGYRAVEARDSVVAGEAYLGLPEPPEIRFGRGCLTLPEARSVKVGDEVYHLGRRESAVIRAISAPRPELPHFDVGHGPEVYTLFGDADEEQSTLFES